jgi:curved DNA-binding protein CbpA
VRRDASIDELRRAYRRGALDAHPDRRTGSAPAEAMAALNEAWNVLRDPHRRAEYDRLLTTPAPSRAPGRPSPPPPAEEPAAFDANDDGEAPWVDLTRDVRRLRLLMTGFVVFFVVLVVLVFAFIIWPGTS